MTYLQLLGDLGLFGFMAYLGIFAVVLRTPHRIAATWRVDRAGVVGSVGVIAIFLANGVFVPLSNEVSEWMVVIVAAAVFVTARERPISRVRGRTEPVA